MPRSYLSASTTLTSSSVIGVLWCHFLGDASSAHRFLRDLSSLYVGDPVKEPPSFFPHIHLPVYPPLPEATSRRGILENATQPTVQLQPRLSG